MRQFPSGATRDNDDTKNDYEGYLSPLVIESYGRYMSRHRIQADGKLRAADNWQKGIPLGAYMSSMWRHFMDVWAHHRGLASIAKEPLEEALCALLFNVMGFLHETLKERSDEIIFNDAADFVDGRRQEHRGGDFGGIEFTEGEIARSLRESGGVLRTPLPDATGTP